MALAASTRHLSEEEYLHLERLAVCKSEFYSGEVFAMSGGTAFHSIIAVKRVPGL